jgi:hypothetical protein
MAVVVAVDRYSSKALLAEVVARVAVVRSQQLWLLAHTRWLWVLGAF